MFICVRISSLPVRQALTLHTWAARFADRPSRCNLFVISQGAMEDPDANALFSLLAVPLVLLAQCSTVRAPSPATAGQPPYGAR